jgi:hypothetical protein
MNTTRIRPPVLLLVAAAYATATGCASIPAESDPDPEQFAAEVDRRLDFDPNKRTCRTIRPTGSRLAERICKSNAEWAGIEQESRNTINKVQRDQSIIQGGGD